MARVKNKNTAPEIIVRKAIHRLGYRFRLHRRNLPGNPDIVLSRHRKVIFVHGCFWHGHPGCRRAVRPATNTEFWNTKLDKNIRRDEDMQRSLEDLGWRVLVVWECETKRSDDLEQILVSFLQHEEPRGVNDGKEAGS